MNDTNLILGMTWEEIKILQQKGVIDRSIKHTPLPVATEADISMLKRFGVDGLKTNQYFGVIDRLQNSGIVQKEAN